MINFANAINNALIQSMEQDEKVICYGLGVDDPKRIFGTTNDLAEKFGNERVFDIPISENAMTGVAIGAAIGGYKPVFVHQRLDFFLLAMDQLVNGAAKWHFMFGGQNSVPLVIRLVVGRGWGQGPTHCQSLHAWFSHIPGLKVVMPSNPVDAKGLLLSSINDPNPVVFVEHRWLHNMSGEVPEEVYYTPLGEATTPRKGTDITLVTSSILVPEALTAAVELEKIGINCEVVDLRTIRPIDEKTILKSVSKTKRVLAIDIGAEFGSVADSIVSKVSEKLFKDLQAAPAKLTCPDHAIATSFGLTKDVYPDAASIADKVCSMFDKAPIGEVIRAKMQWPHDVPGSWFNGPF